MVRIIFDVFNIAHRSGKTKSTMWMESKGRSSGHIFGSFRQIVKLARKFEDSHLVFAYDKYPKRKHEIYSEYKANKTHSEESNYIIKGVERMLDMFPGEKIWAEGEECDDVIASYITKYPNDPIVISSNDKDLWQLLSLENISIFGKEKILEEHVQDKFNLSFKDAYKIALYKSIYGDAGDNIPNLSTRVQWKYIERVFLKCDGTPEDFMKLAEENLIYKRFSKFKEKEETLKTNYKLANLKKDIEYNSFAQKGNKEELEYFLISWDCESLVKDLELLNWS